MPSDADYAAMAGQRTPAVDEQIRQEQEASRRAATRQESHDDFDPNSFSVEVPLVLKEGDVFVGSKIPIGLFLVHEFGHPTLAMLEAEVEGLKNGTLTDVDAHYTKPIGRYRITFEKVGE